MSADRDTDKSRSLDGLDPDLARLARLVQQGHSDQQIVSITGLPRQVVRARLSAVLLELGLCSRGELRELNGAPAARKSAGDDTEPCAG